MTRTGAAAVVVVALLGLVVSSTMGLKGVQAVLTAPKDRTLAPDFALKDTAGKVVRLSEYRGRVVLLDFWATTCAGCIQEIPMFIGISKTYDGRGFATIGVSEDIAYADLKNADEAWDRVRPFVRDHQVPYLVLMGDSRVTADYGIKALPLTYLVDAEGRVAAIYSGVVARGNLEANIKTLLAEPR
jgi:peroxiredoxin